MAKVTEIAFTSDGTGQLWNSCAWDLKTGTAIATFKSGGISGAKSLSLVGDSYLISAQKDKPLLQAWSLNAKDQQQIRIVCPGKVSALALSENGEFCVAAIEEKFHLWQVSDGTLLAVVARHYQPISCLKFSDDGLCIFSAGDDGLVMVWSLGSLLAEINDPLTVSHLEPDQLWSDHQLTVSDICVGRQGIDGRIATVSSDMTCKMYEVASGRLLVTFVLDVALTAAVFDGMEHYIFLGGVDGRVYQIGLADPLNSQNVHFGDEEKSRMAFIGHSKQVTALSVSLDGACLLSASYDTTARLWHIPSKQCLRVFQHKGPVLNAFLAIAPQSLLSSTPMKPSRTLNPAFQRARATVESDATVNKITMEKILNLYGSHSEVDKEGHPLNECLKTDENFVPGKSKEDLLQELDKLQTINHQLYNYSVQSIFSAIDK